MSSEIKRGEFYWVNWGQGRGSEQKGERPSLVIQNDTGNKFGATVILASCSTKFKDIYPFQVYIKATESGLPEDSVVDLGQIMTADKSRLLEKCGKLNKDKMDEVNKAIEVSLGL
jgi:mRNA interferase MazF